MESFLSLFESTSASFTHVVHTRIRQACRQEKTSEKPKFLRRYYNIPSKNIKQFYKLYLEKVKNSNYDDFVYVCEFSPTYSHLLFDLDFNFATPDADVTEDQVAIVVKLLEAGIRKYVPLLTDISSIVLKRAHAIKKLVNDGSLSDKSPNKVVVYRRGLHIHFPFVVSHYKLACMIKRDIIRYLVAEWNSKFFDIDHVNTLDNVIDDHIFCQRTLQLYKSTRPDHYKDNCYLPFVATGCLKSIDFADEMRILKLVSKYNDMDRFLNESLCSTMSLIDVLDPLHTLSTRGYDQEYDQEYDQDYDQGYGQEYEYYHLGNMPTQNEVKTDEYHDKDDGYGSSDIKIVY